MCSVVLHYNAAVPAVNHVRLVSSVFASDAVTLS